MADGKHNDNQTLILAVLLVIGIGGGCLCLFNNFRQMDRAHKWATFHMPLLPDSSNLRLDAALRDAEEGFNVCVACGFENLKRNIFCTICGSPIECPEDANGKKNKKKHKPKDKLHIERQRVSANLNRRRQARARKRKEWVRKVDVEGKLFWYRDASIGSETHFPGYVLHFAGDRKPQVEPENEPTDSTDPVAADVNPNATPTIAVGEPAVVTTTATIEVTPDDENVVRRSIVTSAVDENADTVADGDQTPEGRRKAKPEELVLLNMDEVNRRLVEEIATRPMSVHESVDADPARPAINDSPHSYLTKDPKTVVEHAQLDFPSKIAEFVTRASTALVPTDQAFLKLKIRRDHVLHDSIETIAATPDKFARCGIRVAFVGEQGLDAGGVYREWLVMLHEQLVSPSTGIFRCVDSNDQTFHLNPMSRHDIGEHHLAHFFSAGRILGRALLEGNVTGFHLSLPLLKIILGQPVTFSDLEYFDPDSYRSMLWMLDNDNVAELGLDFTVTEKTAKGETITVELIPGGRNIDVNDENKFEYVDSKLKYLLFDSISTQLFAFLKGLYEVMPPEMLMMFDAEELDFLVSGSDEIDVDDWERNSKYTADLIEHPVREWFWELVREMPNEYRRRLLMFSTGSSRVPLAGFMALTSYDGRLCPFTLKGVDLDVEGGYIRSHACFNRLDLPRYGSKHQLKAVLYAVLDTELYGFTTD